VYLVMQPLGGDEVQFLKAGIMEVPHAFVLNKCDEPASERSYHTLRGTIGLARPLDGDSVPIYRTSAKTGIGIDELTLGLLHDLAHHDAKRVGDKEPYFFERWVRDEWGRFGVHVLDRSFGGAAAYLLAAQGFERAQAEFSSRLREQLALGR
jgi:LAO/AO transport system kinase